MYNPSVLLNKFFRINQIIIKNFDKPHYVPYILEVIGVLDFVKTDSSLRTNATIHITDTHNVPKILELIKYQTFMTTVYDYELTELVINYASSKESYGQSYTHSIQIFGHGRHSKIDFDPSNFKTDFIVTPHIAELINNIVYDNFGPKMISFPTKDDKFDL